jgi:acylphosphatase
LGGVQGVGYRYSTRHKARELGLAGWVRNLADGSVEVEACGAIEVVEALIAWCRKGPANARVKDVVVEWRDDSADGTASGAVPSFDIR